MPLRPCSTYTTNSNEPLKFKLISIFDMFILNGNSFQRLDIIDSENGPKMGTRANALNSYMLPTIFPYIDSGQNVMHITVTDAIIVLLHHYILLLYYMIAIIVISCFIDNSTFDTNTFTHKHAGAANSMRLFKYITSGN